MTTKHKILYKGKNMDAKIIVSIIAMIVFIAVIQTSKYWIGTKLGDVMIALLGVGAAYGFISGATSLYAWIIK